MSKRYVKDVYAINNTKDIREYIKNINTRLAEEDRKMNDNEREGYIYLCNETRKFLEIDNLLLLSDMGTEEDEIKVYVFDAVISEINGEYPLAIKFDKDKESIYIEL